MASQLKKLATAEKFQRFAEALLGFSRKGDLWNHGSCTSGRPGS